MPLSAPRVGRKHVHNRTIECNSFERDDGMWDIEGHLTDCKSYGFSNAFRGEIAAGEPIHDMWLRLTVDRNYKIQDVEAMTDAGPFALCPSITSSFGSLVGLTIEPGWYREVRRRVGGVKGCTHLVDLLRPMATVAFHTIRWSRSPSTNKKSKRLARPPINTCHVWAGDGELVRKEFPEFYTGPQNNAQGDGQASPGARATTDKA